MATYHKDQKTTAMVIAESILYELTELENLIKEGNTQAELEFLRIRTALEKIEIDNPSLRFSS